MKYYIGSCHDMLTLITQSPEFPKSIRNRYLRILKILQKLEAECFSRSQDLFATKYGLQSIGRSGIVLEGRCYRDEYFWLVIVWKCSNQQVINMLSDMITMIVNSIRGAELFQAPYPVGMSTSLSYQGLRLQRRIPFGVRLKSYVQKNGPKSELTAPVVFIHSTYNPWGKIEVLAKLNC